MIFRLSSWACECGAVAGPLSCRDVVGRGEERALPAPERADVADVADAERAGYLVLDAPGTPAGHLGLHHGVQPVKQLLGKLAGAAVRADSAASALDHDRI